MYFFTADEHFGHAKIIKYCNRPFSSVEEMNETIITNHNEVVTGRDIVIHAGDFCWARTYNEAYVKYISKLKGNHHFIKGSHDRWLPESAKFIWRKVIDKRFIFVCHYAMRTWERSHYNTWQLYGHSHGQLDPLPSQMDVGVDTNNFYPYSWDDIKKALEDRSD